MICNEKQCRQCEWNLICEAYLTRQEPEPTNITAADRGITDE